MEKQESNTFKYAKTDLKKQVKGLLDKGITEDTLLQFYMISCNFGHRFSPYITSTDLKKYFKEAFDEYDLEQKPQ